MLLVDEIDKADVEVEGLLLEVLCDFQVTVPELGTITAARRPFALLTSNSTRELSEALKRRCLFLHLDFPDAELERRIVLARVPELAESLVDALVRTVRVLRALELRKSPSVAETIDWGRTLLALGPRHPRRRRGAGHARASCSSTSPTPCKAAGRAAA